MKVKDILLEHVNKKKYFILRTRDSKKHNPFGLLKDLSSEFYIFPKTPGEYKLEPINE